MPDDLLYVVPDKLTYRRGDDIIYRIAGLAVSTNPTHVRVDLARIGWYYTEWAWQSGAIPTQKKNSFSVSFAKVDLPDGVYEVSRVGLSFGAPDDTSAIDWRQPPEHFPRAFLVVSESISCPDLAPSNLRSRVNLIEHCRQQQFQSGIEADPSAPGLGRFRGLAFVQRTLVTRPIRLRGFEIIPLKIGLRRLEEFDLINKFLIESGIGVGLTLTRDILRGTERDNPVMAVHFPLVRAVNHEAALDAVALHAQTAVDVLSPHRSSYGEIFATLLENLDTRRAWYVPGGDRYRGNIIGGLISGENPPVLQDHIDSALADPMLRLFVSLHREATAERNLDFAYFRYWNLLETMAILRIRLGQTVTDFSGNPVFRDSNKRVTTKAGDGKVYELLKRHFVRLNFTDKTFGSGLKTATLWELCRVWYAFRNATAHYGGFRANDPAQKQGLSGYQLARKAHNDIIAQSGERTWFSDRYFQTLCRVAERVVTSEISSPLP